MANFMKALEITGEMLNRRARVRRLFGERYGSVVADATRIIRRIADRDGLGVLAAGLKICEQAARDGHHDAINLVIAATVDLVEADKAGGQQ